MRDRAVERIGDGEMNVCLFHLLTGGIAAAVRGDGGALDLEASGPAWQIRDRNRVQRHENRCPLPGGLSTGVGPSSIPPLDTNPAGG